MREGRGEGEEGGKEVGRGDEGRVGENLSQNNISIPPPSFPFSSHSLL